MKELEAVFLDIESVDRGDLDLGPLRRTANRWDFFPATSRECVVDRVGRAEVVVTNKVPMGRDTIAGASSLRLICVAATGTNNIDLDAAREHGIAVTNVAGYATPAVVQHVFALVLALSARIFDYHRLVLDGAWERSPQFCLLDFPVRELAGLTLGVVGYGELGHAVARAASLAFGMSVMVAERPGAPLRPGRVHLDELLARADVVSLHCPLTPDTEGLIGARELALMKTDALLINTARGGIVDEQALADALRSGRLGGAGIDVLSQEPPREGSPLLNSRIPNLILTPHVAWASRQARQRLVEEVAANILAFLDGKKRNRLC